MKGLRQNRASRCLFGSVWEELLKQNYTFVFLLSVSALHSQEIKDGHSCRKICKAALFKFVWLKLSNFASMSQDETNKTNKKKCFDSEFFFSSNQSEREMVSQQFSPSSLLWLTWILLNNACAPPPSTRGRQFPNLHRVALNQSSKKYTHTQEVQRFCLYKCCDPDLDPDPDPHPNLTPKSASNEHWHRW